MIISLHTPKAGGTTFLKLLQSHFGKEIRLDYNDFPIKTEVKTRNAKATKDSKRIKLLYNTGLKYNATACIHGHFLPYKYHALLEKKNVNFVTWLRDPVERLASHYYYWKRMANSPMPKSGVERRMIEEDWSLEKFCFSVEMQNTYAQFLWRFPITNFDFVGITECYNEDIDYFAKRFLGITDVEKLVENTNPEKPTRYVTDAGLRAELEAFHFKDYEIYNAALEMRRAR